MLNTIILTHAFKRRTPQLVITVKDGLGNLLKVELQLFGEHVLDGRFDVGLALEKARASFRLEPFAKRFNLAFYIMAMA